MEKKATFIRDLDGFTGSAKLYKLDPPIKEYDFEDDIKAEHEYVVVSATNVPYSGDETYIFPSDKDGKVKSWGELEGSFRGEKDHDQALRYAGYKVG